MCSRVGSLSSWAVIVVIQLWEQGDVARWLAEAPEEWALALITLVVAGIEVVRAIVNREAQHPD